MYEVNQILTHLRKTIKKEKTIYFGKFFKSDLDTPVSAYLKLCQNSNKKNCFLLEQFKMAPIELDIR